MASWSWSSELITKCTKWSVNFIPLHKMYKLWFINQFIVVSLYLFRGIKKTLRLDPNGHTTSTPHRFDVDITSIRQRPNFDEFLCHFRVLFQCNFDGRKIHVVSTYFLRGNFDGWNMHVVFTYFFLGNFDGQKFDIVFGKLKANENIREGFFCACNFKGTLMQIWKFPYMFLFI